jgi:cell division septum initiation protein DivIVA
MTRQSKRAQGGSARACVVIRQSSSMGKGQTESGDDALKLRVESLKQKLNAKNEEIVLLGYQNDALQVDNRAAHERSEALEAAAAAETAKLTLAVSHVEASRDEALRALEAATEENGRLKRKAWDEHFSEAAAAAAAGVPSQEEKESEEVSASELLEAARADVAKEQAVAKQACEQLVGLRRENEELEGQLASLTQQTQTQTSLLSSPQGGGGGTTTAADAAVAAAAATAAAAAAAALIDTLRADLERETAAANAARAQLTAARADARGAVATAAEVRKQLADAKKEGDELRRFALGLSDFGSGGGSSSGIGDSHSCGKGVNGVGDASGGGGGGGGGAAYDALKKQAAGEAAALREQLEAAASDISARDGALQASGARVAALERRVVAAEAEAAGGAARASAAEAAARAAEAAARAAEAAAAAVGAVQLHPALS